MTASATPSAASANERLMRLVPEQVGEWAQHSLKGARPGPDGKTRPAALAEFRNGTRRATVVVSEAGALRVEPPAAPSERNTGAAIEKIYAEAGGAVRETVRKADDRGDLTYSRADGIVVTVQGTHVPAADLKALAMAIKPLAKATR